MFILFGSKADRAQGYIHAFADTKFTNVYTEKKMKFDAGIH
jgi:hypothetical protein